MSLAEMCGEWLDALDALSALYAKHLPTGRGIAIRADVPINTPSVIKLPIMILAYRDADAGRLDLDERYTLGPDDMCRGSGLLQTFDLGLQPTYRDLIAQMIITSDNTATDVMIARLDTDRVNAMLEAMGYAVTRLQKTTNELTISGPAHVEISLPVGCRSSPDLHCVPLRPSTRLTYLGGCTSPERVSRTG